MKDLNYVIGNASSEEEFLKDFSEYYFLVVKTRKDPQELVDSVNKIKEKYGISHKAIIYNVYVYMEKIKERWAK